MSFAQYLTVCHGCKYRQKVCNGPCACQIDQIDIMDHARAETCPKGLYVNLPTLNAVKPLARKMEPKEITPCNCSRKSTLLVKDLDTLAAIDHNTPATLSSPLPDDKTSNPTDSK